MEFAVGLLALAVTYLAWRNGRVVRENTERMLKASAENTENILKASAENTDKILNVILETTRTTKEGFKVLGRIIVADTPEEKRKLSQELEKL